jgi:hypothetical protein
MDERNTNAIPFVAHSSGNGDMKRSTPTAAKRTISAAFPLTYAARRILEGTFIRVMRKGELNEENSIDH